jgi:hypothetical protein
LERRATKISVNAAAALRERSLTWFGREKSAQRKVGVPCSEKILPVGKTMSSGYASNRSVSWIRWNEAIGHFVAVFMRAFVSVAHAVVLENAGTKGLYKKSCFSSRLHSLVFQVRAPESRERGPQHCANHLRTTRLVL